METAEYYRGWFVASFAYLIEGGRKRIRLIEKKMVSHWFNKIWGVNPAFTQEFTELYLNPNEMYCYVYVSDEEREKYLSSEIL